MDVPLDLVTGVVDVGEVGQAEGQSAQCERGGGGPCEGGEACGDGAAVGWRGVLVKRRCFSPALFGVHG